MNTRTENAIQSDATAQSENQISGDGESVYTPSPRDTALEAIAAQRRKSLEADGVDLGAMETDADKPVIDPDVDSDDAQLAEQLSQDDRPSPVFAKDNTLVKVKIDGEELELPLSEVVKGFQKDQTASRRLTEATRLLALAEQQASKVAQNEKQESNSTSQGTPSEADLAARRSKISDAFTKLYEGDQDGAVEAMLAIVAESGAPAATQKTPEIDTAAIAAQVKQQLDVESAYAATRLDYPDLFEDTERGAVLGRETLARINQKASQGIPRGQAVQESAREVAELFGLKKPGRRTSEVPPRTARDTKLERKADLDSPSAANVVAGNTQSPAEVQNVHSVIAEMARGRLGQSLNAR